MEPPVIPAPDAANTRYNALADAYQPRRQWAAIFSVVLNLAAIGAMVLTGGAEWIYEQFTRFRIHEYAIVPMCIAILFAAHAILNFPIELWFGYLEERQFGLAKAGIRAWTHDWLAGVIHHGILFTLGSCLIVALQMLVPGGWLYYAVGSLLILFLGTSYFATAMIPRNLFQIEPADSGTINRLTLLAGRDLPRILIFSATNQRDFAGGLVGIASRQRLLISRSTINAASDNLLRFVLLHELGHRRWRHVLLATLLGWFWIVSGVVLCDLLAPLNVSGTPVYIAWLAMILTAWLALTEPLVAWIGRRFEYAADRHFLRNGGTLDEMRAALQELSRRNLASTDAQSRRRTIFHPLPSVDARLRCAERFLNKRKAD